MASAQVRVRHPSGSYIIARALLDTCATAHFVTENFVKRLSLPTNPCSIPVGAINNMNTISKGSTEFSFYSIHNNFNKDLVFLIVPQIADNVPSERFPRELINIPAHVQLADPEFHLPRPVDMLIGSGATLSLLSIGQIDLSQSDCDLILQKTRLGWITAGGIKSRKGQVSCKLTDLSKQIEKFWLLDDITANQIKPLEIVECEEHYKQNTKRDLSGRYIVRLPFRSVDRDLGDSRSVALRRFYGLQRKLNKNPNFREQYQRVLEEYIKLGHMSLITDESTPGYYLPHHAVVKDSSATTKLRVVFDASAETNKGTSLNKLLMVGPTIQQKLFEHLLRFRIFEYVLTADIAKMYRQVWLHPDDRRYQRIFWFHNNNIRTFQLNTVTFGISSAPFLAIRTLHQLADDEHKSYPVGAKILKRDFYVDDLLSGANTLDELIIIRNEVIKILKCGGFDIRQWASNNPQALSGFDEISNDIELLKDENPIRKTLGISWNAQRDELIYTVKPMENLSQVTKRKITSEIAKIFDPLGLLAPIILASKLIIQECWKAQITWDESVPQTLYSIWHKFSEQLRLIDNFTIERKVILSNAVDIQIHGFCDASVVGYGACLYVRSRDKKGNIYVRLLCAKGRVSPIPPVTDNSVSKKSKRRPVLTIPRAELCGALTLARLFKEVQPTIALDINKVIFWSDSTIALQWISKSPDVLKIFESNRVREIQKVSKNIEWRHIKSENNPADGLSRSQMPREFLKNEIWFRGPLWLSLSESSWPKSIIKFEGELPGLKKATCLTIQANPDDIFSRFSSYPRLIRFVAYSLRFLRTNKCKDDLSITEIDEAERRVIKLIQGKYFGDEITRIANKEEPKSAKLGSLAPLLDEHGILRVGGRLKHANIPKNQKHPILLPSCNYVTDILIRHIHKSFHHSGIQSTLYHVRHKYWILNGKNQVRQIIRKCVTCIRYRAAPVDYQMASLPKSRLDNVMPFHHVGLDYFGPMYVKEKKHRNRGRVKVWGCVFICMTTKAIHLEIVSDLTTEAFLAALKRFIGRRGVPNHIYSDNGTNFVGANNQLRELYALMESTDHCNQVNDFAVNHKITWQFNPPLSPHFGGLWEAAVKSSKYHFKRVTGDRLFTYEELNTLAIEIEAILNSRPLCPISTDPNDPIALTPAHLLVGRPLTMLPENNFTLVPENRLTSYQTITKARQHFWQRWQLEYLTELQKRQKWIKPTAGLEINDIVLLIEKNQPCMQWRLGRIIDVYPGDDGTVRVISVKTSQGIFKRSAKNVCLLPTSA